MPTESSLGSNNIHALLHEHLDSMLDECNRVMDNAADNVYCRTILMSAAPSKRPKEPSNFMLMESSFRFSLPRER